MEMDLFSKIGAILSSANFKISIGVFIFITIMSFIIISTTGKKKAKRYIDRIDEHRNFEKNYIDENDKDTGNYMYDKYVKSYIRKNKDLYEKLLGIFGIDLKKIEKKLIRGNITKVTAEQISIIKIGGVFLSLFVGITLLLFMGITGLLIGLAIAAATLLLPEILIDEQYNLRKNEILYVLPTTLKLMADATSTGHTVNDAIMRVRRKYKNVLADEFEKAEEEARYSNDWLLALENMADRCDIDEIYNLIAEIKITQEKGTPITDVLINYANKIETEATIRLTEVARKRNTTLLVPILLFLFAPLIGLILLPAFDMVLGAL